MIISKTVRVKNSKYYKDLGYDNSAEFIDVIIKDLTYGSGKRILVSCTHCEKEDTIQYYSYNKNISKTGIYSCKGCSFIKRKQTNLERYGVENVMHLNDFKERAKKTNLERYGVENVFSSESIKDKIKISNMDRYGVECSLLNDEIKDKIKLAMLEKYGVEHPMKSSEIRNNIKQTNMDRYGVENVFSSESIKDKIKQTNLEKYGYECSLLNSEIKDKIKSTILEKYGVDHQMKSTIVKDCVRRTNLERYGVDHYLKSTNFFETTKIGNDIDYIKYIGDSISLFKCDKGHTFEIHIDNYHNRNNDNIQLCTICNPISSSKSIKEKDLLDFMKSIYNEEIIPGHRDGIEIDIYLPKLKIGFEFNGLYWHSKRFKDKNYHINKTNHFKEKGIRIIHIWEDDWTFKRDIIKSQITNILKVKSESIFARKCIVKEIDTKLARKFLNSNHIQGFVPSKIKLGLYYKEELVSIMTFDSNEGRKKMKNGEYNLNRFCNKLSTGVVGGASKLLSYFIKTNSPSRLISYADKDWSIGDLYYKLGFVNICENGPDYKYIIDGRRVHKSRYKKSKLNTELSESNQMELNGILKIYDCGKIKFEK